MVEFMKKIDAPALDEQVIAVPKISLERVSKLCPRRLPRRVVARLVEVPTLLCSSGFPSRSLTFQFLRVGGWTGHGGLEGVSQGQGSTALCGADPVDIPVPRSGGLQGFFPRLGSTASSTSSHVRAGAADEPFQGVFRTFPDEKKCGLGPHSGSELGADFFPWTPAAYAESMAGADDENESESEVEAEAEEGAATRFAAGFRSWRVCTRFFEHQLGRPVWMCTYGDRCTFAHSWAELHPEASAREQQLASYFLD